MLDPSVGFLEVLDLAFYIILEGMYNFLRTALTLFSDIFRQLQKFRVRSHQDFQYQEEHHLQVFLPMGGSGGGTRLLTVLVCNF